MRHFICSENKYICIENDCYTLYIFLSLTVYNHSVFILFYLLALYIVNIGINV